MITLAKRTDQHGVKLVWEDWARGLEKSGKARADYLISRTWEGATSTVTLYTRNRRSSYQHEIVITQLPKSIENI